MAWDESLRGFVNTWQCDENAHLNVQFYFGFFEDAAAHFLRGAGVEAASRPRPTARHVRFHAEMTSGQLVRVETCAAPGEGGAWHLVHRLREPAGERVAATALDSFAGSHEAAARARARAAGEVPAEARPRSVPLAPARLDDAPEESGGALVSWRGRLGAAELDRDGRATHAAVVACLSDANAHAWESVGAAQHWLAERGFGRVAVEMKVTTGRAVAAGLAHLESRPVAVGSRTISYRHRLVASDTGEVAAVCEATGLLIDLEARRSVPLPDEIREAAGRRLDAAGTGRPGDGR